MSRSSVRVAGQETLLSCSLRPALRNSSANSCSFIRFSKRCSTVRRRFSRSRVRSTSFLYASMTGSRPNLRFFFAISRLNYTLPKRDPNQDQSERWCLNLQNCCGVSTESGSDRVTILEFSILAISGDPVATALGTDLILKLRHHQANASYNGSELSVGGDFE